VSAKCKIGLEKIAHNHTILADYGPDFRVINHDYTGCHFRNNPKIITIIPEIITQSVISGDLV